MKGDLVSRRFLLECAEYDSNGRLVIPYKDVETAPVAFDKENVIAQIKEESHAENLEWTGTSGEVYYHYIEKVIEEEDVIKIIERGGLN